MNHRFLFAVAATVALSGGWALDAAAQGAYPERPITVLVPAAAGGPSDTVARILSQSMSTTLGQQVLVENMGGAGGSLGTGKIAAAKPDGYSLLLYHIGVAAFNSLYPNLPYKAATAFDGIGMITEVPMTVVARNDFPPKDIKELFDYVKAKGKEVTFGTAGVGGAADLCGMLLQRALNFKMTFVPYKGTGPAMTDLVGGRIDYMCDQTTNTMPQIKAGQIKVYAVASRERNPVLPDIVTLQEAGLKDFEITAWHAIWAPKGTPEPIRKKLAAALQTALKDPMVIERFGQLGTVPVKPDMATNEYLDKWFQSEIKLWADVIGANPEKR